MALHAAVAAMAEVGALRDLIDTDPGLMHAANGEGDLPIHTAGPCAGATPPPPRSSPGRWTSTSSSTPPTSTG